MDRYIEVFKNNLLHELHQIGSRFHIDNQYRFVTCPYSKPVSNYNQWDIYDYNCELLDKTREYYY